MIHGLHRLGVSTALFLFIILIPMHAICQDSSDLTNAKTVSELLELADEAAFDGDYDLQEDYLNKALLLAQKGRNDDDLINALTEKALFNFEFGDSQDSLDALYEALKLAENQSDKELEASVLSDLGYVYLLTGLYPQVINYISRAKDIYQLVEDDNNLPISLNNLAIAYEAMDDLEMAELLYAELFAFATSTNDTLLIALYHINMFDIILTREDYERAESYLNKALELVIDNPSDDLVYIYTLKALLAETLEQTEDAYRYYQKAFEATIEYGSSYEHALIRWNLAEFHFYNEEFTLARDFGKEALEISKDRGFNSLTYELYYLIARTDSITQNYEAAYKNFMQYIYYRDIVHNEENAREMTRLKMQADFDKREALTAEQLKRRQLQRNASAGGMMFLGGFAFVFWRQRNKIKIEKDHSEHLLLNILPYETAQELKEKGYTDAQIISHVTVLFTDFKGFTQLSEKLTPNELVSVIHECFSAFDKIMGKYGVEKIKTIGDAYMAAGGLPTVNETHPKDVVSVALEIQEYMKEHIRKKKEAGLPYFEIRIGVHTGPVIAGIVGLKKFQYDIWGDTVNTASRMESSGQVGMVNVSASTKALIENDFDCKYRGEIEAKGKGKIAMYFVDRLKHNNHETKI